MAISRKLAAQLEGRFTKVARVFARNHHLQVRMIGTKCNTTSDNVINLPANADYLDDETADVMEGLLDHEWSHQAEESEARESKGRSPSPLAIMKTCKENREKMILNAFEDIRIEIKESKAFVGVAENLNHSNKFLIDRVMRPRFASGKFDPWWAIGCGIIGAARGWDLGWLPAPFIEILELLKEEIDESRDMRDCNDCLRLTKRVLAKLNDIANTEPEPEGGEGEPSAGEDGEGEDADGSEDGEGEGDSSGEGDDDGEEDGKPSDAAGKPSDKDGKGKPSRKPSASASKAAKELLSKDSDSADLTDKLKDEVERRAEYDIKTNRRHIAHPTAQLADQTERMPPTTDETYQRLLNEVRPAIGGLRSKILTVLQSRRARRYVGDQEQGGVDAGALYGLRFGNKRVFTTRTADTDVNTVVGILVDESGSMGSKAHTAKRAVIALAECLDKVNIPFCVYGFSNLSSNVPDRERHAELYNRFEPLHMLQYKRFDDNFKRVRSSMANISGRMNNTDGDALLHVARMLNHRPEERKILMVLSDGEPAADGDCNLLAKHLTEVVHQIIAAHIEVFGIGIMTDSVKQFYPDYAVVNNMGELARNTFQMLKKYLLAKKPSHKRGGRL